jgi:DNA-binding CsgD family transcriptional regulator
LRFFTIEAFSLEYAQLRMNLLAADGRFCYTPMNNFMSPPTQRGVGSAQLAPLGLTQREAEVLYWISQGKSNGDIGVILGASTRTICKHVEHIFSKLSVENRTAAAAIALAVLYQLTDLL